MDRVLERLDGIILKLDRIDARLAEIGVRLETFATKADLHEALNTQTWKLVTFVSGFGTALVAATFFIAKTIH